MEERSLTEEDVTAEKSLLCKFSFPKSKRILKRYEYVRLFRKSSRVVGRVICVDYFFENSSSNTRLGITVSTRYGNAYKRNLFKRKVREAFRLLYPSLPKNLSINIIPRYKAKQAKMEDIKTELQELIGSVSRS